jgi:hypothetical protein
MENTDRISNEEIISELRSLIDSYSHNVPYEDDQEQVYSVVETRDVERIGDEVNDLIESHSYEIKGKKGFYETYDVINVSDVENYIEKTLS